MADNQIISTPNLRLFGTDYVKLLIKYLLKFKKNSTGSLIKSLDSRLQGEAENIKIIIDSNDYLNYVDEGRKPGSYPNIKAISKWAELKGIKGAEFAIANKIFKFGIKPTQVIQNTINEFEDTFATKYESTIAMDVENKVYGDIKTELKTINDTITQIK